VMLTEFIDLQQQSADVPRVALVIDSRERRFLDLAPDVLLALRARPNLTLDLLFLDTDDDTLIRRYTETRRRHPLSDLGSIRDSIQEERRRVAPLRAIASHVIDTSHLTVHDLKRRVTMRYNPTHNGRNMAVTLMSFGFKHGVPAEANLVFDARFLPNPYFDERLRPLRGTDAEVSEFILQHPVSQELLTRLLDLLRFLLPRYEEEGKRYLTIAIGCTGGHHRSVALAEALSDALRPDHNISGTIHRDINR
jgi:RNase adapter protein RapZ